MDWDIILAALGSGGLVGFLNWLINLGVTRRKAELDKDELFRRMTEENNQFIAQLLDEKSEWQELCNTLSEQHAELERLIGEIRRCQHYPVCPVRLKLQNGKTNLHGQRSRQSPLEQKGVRRARSNPGKDVGFPSADTRPP